jgi:hypothetical protein
VQGLTSGNSVLTGLTDITGYPSDIAFQLAKISGNEVKVPLYTANAQATKYGDSYVAYGGNDTVSSINIVILADGSLKSSNAANAIMNNLGMATITAGEFSNGNITVNWKTLGAWTPPNIEPNKIIQLTANQWKNGVFQWIEPYYEGHYGYYVFTATSSEQYIHVKLSGNTYNEVEQSNILTPISIAVYDENGNMLDTKNKEGEERGSLYFSGYLSCELIPGKKYYIETYTSSTNDEYPTFAYELAFNSSPTPPN